MGAGWDSLTLNKAFAEAGYGTDADGLYRHFEEYGNREGISPNPYFVPSQYLYNKAVDYYPAGTTITSNHVESMRQALEGANLSPWEHYMKYGFAEGISPSVNFNGPAYMAAKLAQLVADDPSGNWTMPKLTQVFQTQGFTALTHYYEWGVNENLNFTLGTPGTIGETKSLTTGTDAIYGSGGNDYFNAELGTLNSADYIDGLGGNADVLTAQVNAANTATRPTISNVEKIVFTAQGQVTEDTGNNNVSLSYAYDQKDWNVAIDADRITGSAYKNTSRQVLENKNSRADFAIEDIRINSTATIVSFADADSGDVDYGVFFDDQHLKTENAITRGRLNLQLMDVKNADPAFDGSSNPLSENYFDGFTFAYLDGAGNPSYVALQFRNSTAAQRALYSGNNATYATLLTAFQNALTDWEAQNPSMAGKFSVALGGTFTSTASVNSISYTGTGTSIVLSCNDSAISADTTAYASAGWKVSSGNIPSAVRMVAEADDLATTTCPLIETEIWLDNVGRVQWNDASPNCLPADAIFGSEAGDMVVGGMSKFSGVERFDVKVDQGSWLSSLSSTNNKLRMVVATNEDINEDGVNGNLGVHANNTAAQKGQLFIGDSLFKEDGNLQDWADPLASHIYGSSKGNLASWIDLPKMLSTSGLVDVKWFDAFAFEGSVNIGAQITQQSYGKYFADVDDVRNVDQNYAPFGEFRYELGSNADVLNMKVNGGIAADQDFKMAINGNGGDDFINFSFSDLTANQRTNIISGLSLNTTSSISSANVHDRVIIGGGDGNDVIKSWGDGGMKVIGGGGNDAIYVGQLADGLQHLVTTPGALPTYATEMNAVFLFNLSAPGGPGNILERSIFWDAVNGAQPLANNILSTTNDFIVTRGTVAEDLQVAVTFKGIGTAFFKVADIPAATATATTFRITAEEVNERIAAAIANDTYLKHLIVAKDGAGHSLMIESLVDGELALTDLNIAFRSVLDSNNATLGTATFAGLTTAYTTNEGFANLATLQQDTDSITTQGTASQQEVHTLIAVPVPAVGDSYSIKIGDTAYYTQVPLAGVNLGDLADALNLARDANGNRLSDKYIVGDTLTDLTVTYKVAGIQNDVEVTLYKLNDANNVDGTGYGTISRNIVDAGPGNDTLILNVASTAVNNDVVVISSDIGRDVVVNFDVGVDRFHVDSSMGTFGETVAATAVGNNSANWTTANWTAVLASINAGVGFDVANARGVGYFLSNAATNTYTFFQVENDATAQVVRSEVTILGTMTFDNDATQATLAATGTAMFV